MSAVRFPEQRHPTAVQHLTVEVSAADGQYLAQAKWDTPRGEGCALQSAPDQW
nr:hypothetical protein [Escherichia coli]